MYVALKCEDFQRALSVTSAHLVSWVHPNGVELRQAGVSLRQICQLAAEGKMSDDSSILFRRFEPMLLSRIRYGSANVYDKVINLIFLFLNSKVGCSNWRIEVNHCAFRGLEWGQYKIRDFHV